VSALKAIGRFVATVVVTLVGTPLPLLACAACYGKSDSALALGMNWGIFSLLAVVVFVLGGIAAFFVYLAKRAAATSSDDAAAPMNESEPSKQL